MWKKVNSFNVIKAFSVTSEKLNKNSQLKTLLRGFAFFFLIQIYTIVQTLTEIRVFES